MDPSRAYMASDDKSASSSYLSPIHQGSTYDNHGFIPTLNPVYPDPPPDYPTDHTYLHLQSDHPYDSVPEHPVSQGCCTPKAKIVVVFVLAVIVIVIVCPLILEYVDVIDLNIIPESQTGGREGSVIEESVEDKNCKGHFDIPEGAPVSFQCVFNLTTLALPKVSMAKNEEVFLDTEVYMGYKVENYVRSGSIALLAWQKNNLLITTVDIIPVRCFDIGNFTLQIFENETLLWTHDFSVNVLPPPVKPVVGKVNNTRGSIPGEILELVCRTTIGCSSNDGVTFKKKATGTNFFVTPHGQKTSTFNRTESGLYQETAYLHVSLDQFSDGDEYRCVNNGVKSDVYTVSTVPENFCTKFGDGVCRTQHPNRCDLWVSCENGVNAVIMECPPGLHWNSQDDCSGQCDHTTATNCN